MFNREFCVAPRMSYKYPSGPWRKKGSPPVPEAAKHRHARLPRWHLRHGAAGTGTATHRLWDGTSRHKSTGALVGEGVSLVNAAGQLGLHPGQPCIARLGHTRHPRQVHVRRQNRKLPRDRGQERLPQAIPKHRPRSRRTRRSHQDPRLLTRRHGRKRGSPTWKSPARRVRVHSVSPAQLVARVNTGSLRVSNSDARPCDSTGDSAGPCDSGDWLRAGSSISQ